MESGMDVTVSDIKWDIDGENPEDLDLPSEVVVNVEDEKIDGYEAMADWLSGKYGWSVLEFSTDPALETEAAPSPRS